MIDYIEAVPFVVIKEPSFCERGERDFCRDKPHEWVMLCRKENVAIAICKNCALLEGGWAKYD